MAVRSPLIPRSSIYEFISLDAVNHPALQAGAAYWTMIRGERRYPARDEIYPKAIAGLLPYMSLLKVIDGGADFEHRIVGDVMVQAFHVRIQNRRFSEIAPEAPKLIARSFTLFGKVAETGEPLAWRCHAGHDATDVVYTDSEVLLLPLGKTEAVDHILAFGAHETRVAR